MRILFLALDIDLSRPRGDAIHTCNLMKAFSRAGHVVHTIVGRNGMTARPGSGTVSTCPSGGDLAVLWHVLNVAKRTRAEVVYERRFSPKIGVAAATLLRLPLAVEINGILEFELAMLGRSLPRVTWGVVKRFVRGRLMRRATAIVAVTEGIRQQLIQDYALDPSKVHVVPNGVDENRFFPLDQSQARDVIGAPSGRLICFVGNMVSWQGLDVVINALSYLAGDVHAVFVGGGPELKVLKSLAEARGVLERVRFENEVDHELIPQYVAAADVCVAPKRALKGGYSALKVYEYLACARPIVITTFPGGVEFVKDFHCGVAVSPDDPVAFAAAIDAVLSDETYSTGAKRASEVIRRDYSWDVTAARVVRVLEQGLPGHS